MPQGAIAIKLGGSVITDKSTFKKADLGSIGALCAAAGRLHAEGFRLIIVHGAGSYAHIPSKKYGLADGANGAEGLLHFSEVHSLCEELSTIIVNSLISHGVPAVSFHPATFVLQENKKPKSIDDSMLLAYMEKGFTPVTHGDVVLDTATGTSIISGDALMSHFGRGIAEKLIFASDVDGLLTSPDGDGELIPEVNRENFGEVCGLVGGSRHVDVTGGMSGKIKGLMGLKVESYLVNGKHPERIAQAAKGERGVYTRFMP